MDNGTSGIIASDSGVFDSRTFALRILVTHGRFAEGAVDGTIVCGHQGKRQRHGHGGSQRGDWSERGGEKGGEGSSVHGNEQRPGDGRHGEFSQSKRVFGLKEGATGALRVLRAGRGCRSWDEKRVGSGAALYGGTHYILTPSYWLTATPALVASIT